MHKLILQRLAQMVLIMAVVSLILFVIFDSPQFKKQIAVNELGGFGVSQLSEEAYQQWLEKKGLNVPFFQRYLAMGRQRRARRFRQLLPEERAGGCAARPAVGQHRHPCLLGVCADGAAALVTGVLAGMKEGSAQDRAITFVSVLFTSMPEIATAIVLTVILALGLGLVPAKSAMTQGFDGKQLVLPVLTLVLYDFGYVARMTRASMAEVMTSQYIRTAILKGLPYGRVIMRHALRNALIAPFTVIVLQLNWLLSGVVVVEVFFQYDGFGKMLLEAALFGDIYVIQAATFAAVFVAVVSQIISDVGYTYLNPRIRFA